MLRQKSGSIINLTSIVGMRGQAGQSNYAASKAGIIGFTKSIAEEFGSRSIRCNAISPGFIETDMTHVLNEDIKKNLLTQIPLGRMGKAEEIANAALFLGSDLYCLHYRTGTERLWGHEPLGLLYFFHQILLFFERKTYICVPF
jgi:3-oxoacyl-[acyl-carrier protein] reductase